MQILIVVGSVYGGAAEVAEAVARQAEAAGHGVDVTEAPELSQLSQADALLLITSTTGSGELPDNLHAFYHQLQSQSPCLNALPFAVIALGDTSYGDTYCAAGRQLDAVLENLGAKRSVKRLEIDALEHFIAADGLGNWPKKWLAALA